MNTKEWVKEQKERGAMVDRIGRDEYYRKYGGISEYGGHTEFSIRSVTKFANNVITNYNIRIRLEEIWKINTYEGKIFEHERPLIDGLEYVESSSTATVFVYKTTTPFGPLVMIKVGKNHVAISLNWNLRKNRIGGR